MKKSPVTVRTGGPQCPSSLTSASQSGHQSKHQSPPYQMLLLRNSQTLSDTDGDADFSIAEKGPKLDFYKKNIAYLFLQ